MPNKNWSELNPLQLGKYAEYYAKMEFASYGFDIYTSEVDDHVIDFIAKTKTDRFLEIQVKSARQMNYVYMQKAKWDINNPNTFLTLLLFEEGKLPEIYLIPATAWKTTNELICENDYTGLKSKPEFGLNLSKKNLFLLKPYNFEETLKRSKLIIV